MESLSRLSIKIPGNIMCCADISRRNKADENTFCSMVSQLVIRGILHPLKPCRARMSHLNIRVCREMQLLFSLSVLNMDPNDTRL